MASRVSQLQSQVAGIRKQPVSDDLIRLLESVAAETGVNFEITSGGQSPFGEGPRTGSTRHDDGNAADLKAYVVEDGKKRYLNLNNEADRAKWAEIVRLSVAGGATGIGAGDGTDYMGPHTVHIGYGTPMTWGHGGKSANAPQWLQQAYTAGTRTPPLPITGPAPMPADRSDRIRMAQLGADDIGEGSAANMLSRMFSGQPSPVSMSDTMAYSSGRLQDVPMPRPRPAPAAPSASTSLYSALSRGIVDSVRSPTLFSEGVGIPNEQIPGSDATYSGANRMSVGGLGALLDPRSFSPSTPNPTPLPQPSGPSNRGRPVVSVPPPLPQPSGPTGRGRPTSASSASSTPTPTYSGTTKTTGGIAGTVQLPRDVRPNVPQIAPPSPPSTMSSMGFSQGTVPKYLTKTTEVANPDYKQVNPGNPTLAAMGFSPGTMPTVPKTISKQVTYLNPAWSPTPATQSQSLALQRAAAAPTNYITAGQYTYTKGPNGYQRVTAPTPATQSAALAAQRSGTSTKAKTSSTSTSLPSATFSGTSKGTDGKTRSFDTSTNRWVVVG